MSLSKITPKIIAGANFVSSTIAENDYATWNSGTTYNIGNRVISTTTHRIYECVQDGSLNKDPTDINNRIGTTTLWWLDIGSTNKWALFDFQSSSASTAATTFTVVIAPGEFDTIYMNGLAFGTINVSVEDSVNNIVVYATGNITLDGSIVPDYYEYFFAPFNYLTDYLLQNIPIFASSRVTIVFTAQTGNATCGGLIFGTTVNIGRTLVGAKAKPKTYSYINTDEFGNNTIVKRSSTTDLSLSASVELINANLVMQQLKSGLDTPALWIACDELEFSSLRVFGLASGELSYDNNFFCTLSLTVQGLV